MFVCICLVWSGLVLVLVWSGPVWSGLSVCLWTYTYKCTESRATHAFMLIRPKYGWSPVCSCPSLASVRRKGTEGPSVGSGSSGSSTGSSWQPDMITHYPKITINIDSVTYPPLQSASSKAVWAVIHCIIRLKKALMQLDLTCESDGLIWCKNHGFTILASRSYRCSVGVGCFGPFFGGGPARSTRASSRSSTKANLTKLTRAASKASNYISTAPVSKECVRWSPKLA